MRLVVKPLRGKRNFSYILFFHSTKFQKNFDKIAGRRYGFFRSYAKQVIYRYLDCGILKTGLARIRCGDCGHEYLLAFSCKRRHFCPSCHQKRVMEPDEWLCQEVVKAVPPVCVRRTGRHRHVVFIIPKILRRYFLYDRKPLPIANAPPIGVVPAYDVGVVPAYDEELGHGIDDTITDPDYPAEACF